VSLKNNKNMKKILLFTFLAFSLNGFAQNKQNLLDLDLSGDFVVYNDSLISIMG